MRKQSRRTDTVIVIVLIAIVTFTFLPVHTRDNTSEAQSEPIPIEQYNGKRLGAMPGSLAEDIIREHFPDSPISYYTDTPELYTALVRGKIDGFVSSRIILNQIP